MKNFNFKEYNIADWLSFYRLFITPFILYFIFTDNKFIFAILLTSSFLSDALDGFLARRLKITSERGAFLDSIGDVLLLIVSVIGAFWFEHRLFAEHGLPIWIVLGLYALLSVFVLVKFKKQSSFHTYLAKADFVLMSVFFCYLFFFGFNSWLFYAVIVLSAIELIEEIIIAAVLPALRSNVKGLYWVLKEKNEQSKNNLRG